MLIKCFRWEIPILKTLLELFNKLKLIPKDYHSNLNPPCLARLVSQTLLLSKVLMISAFWSRSKKKIKIICLMRWRLWIVSDSKATSIALRLWNKRKNKLRDLLNPKQGLSILKNLHKELWSLINNL